MTTSTFDLKAHYKGNLLWLPERTIYLCRAGSQAYGTNTPTSDLDVRGIAVPPKEYFLGYAKVFEQAEIKGDPDVVVYDIRKFLKLAADANPNVIELLFTDPSDWFKSTPAFEKLYENRYAFLSKKAKHTFSGYAVAQLKRMRSHRGYLLNPPTHKPTREEYGLNVGQRAVNRDEMGAFDKLISEGQHEFDESVMVVLQKEKAYHNALVQWNQYENWKATRNPIRAALEDKMGYDGKNALHLVRLTRECREILTTGDFQVKRPDAQELLDIRNGAWTYEQLVEWMETQDRELEELCKASTLPHTADLKKLEALCVEIVEELL